MGFLRVLVGLCVVLLSASVVGDVTGTYVLSFGKLSPHEGDSIALGRGVLKEWREGGTNNEVTLQVRATDVKNQFDGTWKDKKREFETSKINLRGTDLDFAFVTEILGTSIIFSWDGVAKGDELRGTLWTVWGNVPVTGTKTEDITGTYLVSFGKLLKEGAFTEWEGVHLLDEWRESATKGGVRIEFLETDVVNQHEIVWTDSTTEALEENLRPRFIFSGTDFFFLLVRMIHEEPFAFLCEGEAKDRELQGTLKSVWGHVEITGKRIEDDHSQPSESKKASLEDDR